jgi:integral membrane protein
VSQVQTAESTFGGTLTRWRGMAIVVGAVLAFMTVVGLPYKYLFDGEGLWYQYGWQVHGMLYMLYLITTIDLAIKDKWAPFKALAVALAGTIPFLSFFFERRVTTEVRARG